MTYRELETRMRKNGCNLADVAIGRMMDIVEETNGEYPDWDDIAPEWVVKASLF